MDKPVDAAVRYEIPEEFANNPEAVAQLEKAAATYGKQAQQWEIGDIAKVLAKGVTRGDIGRAAGLLEDTVRQYIWVAKMFPTAEDRKHDRYYSGNVNAKLSWSHYRELAKIKDAAVRLKKLAEATTGVGWTVVQLVDNIPERIVKRIRVCSQCSSPLSDAGKYRMRVGESREIVRLCSFNCLYEWTCAEDVRNRQQAVEE